MTHDMDMFTLLLIFFGGLLGLFLFGRLLGHIIGLDKFFKETDKTETAVRSGKRRKKKSMKKEKRFDHVLST